MALAVKACFEVTQKCNWMYQNNLPNFGLLGNSIIDDNSVLGTL
jgi:hypothetical protein